LEISGECGIGDLTALAGFEALRDRHGRWEADTPALIRFGQLTQEEFFVSESAAQKGMTIVKPSATDPIVMLKHFEPGNPDLAP
jgi:hypothetical protein